jgi:hypothetical protein
MLLAHINRCSFRGSARFTKWMINPPVGADSDAHLKCFGTSTFGQSELAVMRRL